MDIYNEFINLARLSISGRKDDVLTLVRRASRKILDERPELSEQLKDLLSRGESSVFRRTTQYGSTNLGTDDQFINNLNIQFDIEPVWNTKIKNELNLIVSEHKNSKKLLSANIFPTRSILLVGPPGVGKTLAAQWLSRELKKELFVLNLASIMSSLLGRTGSNLSKVIKNFSETDTILFLDEFDSIGKSRNDVGDVGELKRLVNVLLQSLDTWKGNGILLAATNHPEILDKAVWRRFDKLIEFDFPGFDEQSIFTERRLNSFGLKNIDNELIKLVGLSFQNQSYSELDRWLNSCVRKSVVNDQNIENVLTNEITKRYEKHSIKDRANVAVNLIKLGISQRKSSELLNISRDTIRKYSKKEVLTK